MIFEFESKDGRRLELEYPIGQAPKRVRRGGVTFKRIVSRFQTTAATKPSNDTGFHRAMSMPKWWPHAPRHDTDGTPLFASYSEIREAEAKAKHDGEEAHYDR